MKTTLPFGVAAVLMAMPAAGQDYAVGALTIERPFTYATAPNQPVGGGYMLIVNAGDTDDVLLSAEVAPEIAGMVQLHEMTMEDGVMRMSEIAGGIPVPAGETVTLAQGGLHVMFMNLPDRLAEGMRFPVALTFAEAGTVEVEFTVEPRGGHGAMGHGATDEDG